MEAGDLGDARGTSLRLVEHAGLMTRARKHDTGMLTGEPGVGKTTV